MNIVVVGMGYVGATAVACVADQGHTVQGVDSNPARVQAIQSAASPIIEPGLNEMIAKSVAAGRLRAQTSMPPLDGVDIVIVCVGTPSAASGAHDMSYIAESARQVANAAIGASARITLAYRSTVRPGTMEEVVAPELRSILGDDWSSVIELVYNPEFLRESTAVRDYFDPPRIVIGTDDGHSSAAMRKLYEGFSAPVFETAFREAEVTKFIDNSWHAVKVAFANEFGRLCAAYGVDSKTAHSIFISDHKLNLSSYYMRPGGAFGGSCLPKDLRATQYLAAAAGVEVQLIDAATGSNESHKQFQLARVKAVTQVEDEILIYGLAFKRGTDDLRESPHLDLAAQLLQEGFRVSIVDPAVRSSPPAIAALGAVLPIELDPMKVLIDESDALQRTFEVLVINHDAAPVGINATTVVDLRGVHDVQRPSQQEPLEDRLASGTDTLT